MKIGERLARFMYGRNGTDQLYYFFFFLALALALVNAFIGSQLMTIAGFLLVVIALWRCFSRNLARRQRENYIFCSIGRKTKSFFVLLRNRWRDRKTHIYCRCPGCKSMLRLPRKKGTHTVRCPRCGNRFGVRV